MRLILIFIISLIQDPSYILVQRAEEEAERRYDEFWDCVDRGDCDPNDYPSPDSSFFDIILNPYYIILVVIMIILTNLDWFRSKKSKEKTERYIRYSDLSNRTHGEGGFIEGVLDDEDLKEYLELQKEFVTENMKGSKKDFRRRTFFWLEEQRIKKGLLSGIEFEYRYLFDEFKDELFKKKSRDPFEYDKYRDKVKTVDDLIDFEKTQITGYKKFEKLEEKRKKLEDCFVDEDLKLNSETISKVKEFKKAFFDYIELHLKTYKSEMRLTEICKTNLDKYLYVIDYFKESNKKIPKKIKNEINEITMEMFEKANEVNKKFNKV
jgi:hypothetical protein